VLDLDRTTSDKSGQFSYVFTPDKEGTYTVLATFYGSGGYYGSCAQTNIHVSASEHVLTADEISDATISKLPAYPTIPDIPAYLTIDLVILIIAAVGMVIGLIAYLAIRKQK
jgi:hypothetical protein